MASSLVTDNAPSIFQSPRQGEPLAENFLNSTFVGVGELGTDAGGHEATRPIEESSAGQQLIVGRHASGLVHALPENCIGEFFRRLHGKHPFALRLHFVTVACHCLERTVWTQRRVSILLLRS
ncbi:MAG: hypothetical protein WAU84_07720, partial [Thermoguttaceae bacterium]